MFFSLDSRIATANPAFWNGNSRGTSKFPNSPLYSLHPEINGYDPLYLRGITDLIYGADQWYAFGRGPDAFSMARSTNRTYLLLKRAFWLQSHYVRGDIPEGERDFPPTTTAYLADGAPAAVPERVAGDVEDSPYSDDVTRMVVANRRAVFTPENRPTPKEPLVWASRSEIPPEHKTLSLYLASDCRAKIAVIAREEGDEKESQIVAGREFESTGGEMRRFDLPMPDMNRFVVGLAVEFPDNAGTVTLDRVELVVDNRDETARIHVVKRSANSVEVELKDLPGARILSYIDFLYPGWHAYLDGVETPIYRAFSYFKAIEVPAGTHRVRFEFRPRIVYASVAVSIVSLAVWIGLLVWSFRPARVSARKPATGQANGAPYADS
jgi:hypothetical protein